MDELNELENKINATNTKLQKLEARKYKIISDQIDEKNNYKINAFVYFRNVLIKKEIERRTDLKYFSEEEKINEVKKHFFTKWINRMLYFTCLESVEIDKSIGLFNLFSEWLAYQNGPVESTIYKEILNYKIWFEPKLLVDIDPEISKMIDDNVDKLYNSKLKDHLIPDFEDYNQTKFLIHISMNLYLWREAFETECKHYFINEKDIYTERKVYDDTNINDI